MEHQTIYFVYCLSFRNGKIYIGMSKTDSKGRFDNRYRQHKIAAKSGKSLFVYDAWRKYGDPVQTIISIHDFREECAIAEIDAIKERKATNPEFGYNILNGGQGLNFDDNPWLYELMKERVWNNPERRKKCSEALKGRKPSQATIDASNEWKQSEKGREAFRKAWDNEKRKSKAALRTKDQMKNGGSAHLKKMLRGRGDVRSEEGKLAQKEKTIAFMNSDEGKKIAKKGYAIMASNPENLKKWKERTDRWRATEENKENCKRMAALSALKCSKKVMLVSTGEKFESQSAMAKALNVSCACVSLWVKSGKVERI
mgnify:CR=1 FL=1